MPQNTCPVSLDQVAAPGRKFIIQYLQRDPRVCAWSLYAH